MIHANVLLQTLPQIQNRYRVLFDHYMEIIFTQLCTCIPCFQCYLWANCVQINL